MRALRSGPQVSFYAATVSAHSDSLLLVARLFLAAVFLYSGVVKLVGWQVAISEFELLGVPLPAVAVAAMVAVQLLGGLAIALGWQFRAAAAALAAFTVVATLIGHPFWAFAGVEFQRQLTTALEHLAIVVGFHRAHSAIQVLS
ncbi:MAG: DoxX family protein [Kiloniellaceae bacterium]